MADGVGCLAASMADIGGPRVGGPPTQGYGGCVYGANVGVRAMAHPRRSPIGRPARGVGADGPRGGRGPTPREFLPFATAGEGGTMAPGKPGHVGGLVWASPTARPMGGTAASWVCTMLLAVGDVLHPGELVAMVGHKQSASSEEEDEGQADSSPSSASGSEEWDSDQEVTDRKAPRHGFPLRLGVPHVRGWAQKRAEVEAAMRR